MWRPVRAGSLNFSLQVVIGGNDSGAAPDFAWEIGCTIAFPATRHSVADEDQHPSPDPPRDSLPASTAVISGCEAEGRDSMDLRPSNFEHSYTGYVYVTVVNMYFKLFLISGEAADVEG